MKVVLPILVLSAVLASGGSVLAQDKLVKIGVLTDLSGLYSDFAGQGSTLAAEMAIQDSGLNKKGWTIELVSADTQNKPDVSTNIARQWYDVGAVDIILDVPNSGIALAVSNIAKEMNKILIVSASGASDLTNAQCTPNTIHWTYDTYAVAHGTGESLVKLGGNSWFFIAADYAFGAALQRDTAAVVQESGGTIAGVVRHPLNTSDFSSFLLQAQSSTAKVIGLANAGGDTTNAIKQAAEFGIVSASQKLVPLLMFITDVHSLGLNVAQSLAFTEAFYWDLNDQTREFGKRCSERMKSHAMPSMAQAGVYSSVLHYLKVLEKEGDNPHDGVKIVAAMKVMPTDDSLFGKGEIQPNGRKIHPAYLFEVKKPSESKAPRDFYKLISTIPADRAFTPLKQSTCALLGN
jgi:branched-chain amino acid transport system substrate-binding protein